jgi:hypothetical protein
MSSHEIKLPKATIHPINFWMSWRLSVGSIFVIANTFSGLGSILRQETTYPNNLPEGTSNVHFSFQIFLGCQRYLPSQRSFIFLSLDDHIINVCLCIKPELTM